MWGYVFFSKAEVIRHDDVASGGQGDEYRGELIGLGHKLEFNRLQ